MGRAIRLNARALLDEAVIPQLSEHVLDDLGVLLRRRATVYIEGNGEVVVDAFMDFMVFATKLGGCRLFFEGFGFGRGAVLLVSPV